MSEYAAYQAARSLFRMSDTEVVSAAVIEPSRGISPFRTTETGCSSPVYAS